MECPKCQFDNREGAKFCNECGHKFQLTCPGCGSINRVGSKFCDECGSNLNFPIKQTPKDLSFDEKLTKIQKYLPKGLTEKILSQRNRIEGERKQVTVMFCDMEGFTSLVEILGPEEAYNMMDQIYEILIHKVHKYEGTVNEMTGDGVMALFGAPIAIEDAPQRAIRSAMSIHKGIAKFSDKIRNKDLIQLKMRIGIHTGPVVVGTLGNDLRVEFKAVGDTVNIASRLENLAEPGSTYITEDTVNLTEGLFRFEALGEKEIKGKKERLQIYRVVATSSRRTRFDVRAEKGLTPFIGRDREVELLLDSFERAKSGRGQAFSIMAEAGAGKSRILYELRKSLANEDITFLEGKCLSYRGGISYHSIIDILKSNFNISDNDKQQIIEEKINTGLKILRIDKKTILPYLLELMSVENSGIERIHLSPEAKKAKIVDTFIRLVIKGSEIRPLVMAIEDMHWIDKSSEDCLSKLLDSISGSSVFLLFTYRPEFIHTWGSRSYHNQMILNRLSNRETIEMTSYLLGTKDISIELSELILGKSEGNPFFIEEFISSLTKLEVIMKKDGKIIVQNLNEIKIPSTIQDIIMARVDALPENTKNVLQTGSVIEREFSYELIKAITVLPENELLTHLSVLKDSELIYERGIFPQSTYIFKHALTRDVVNDSILTKRKKRLHEAIGRIMEGLYKDNISGYFGILANHFIHSGNYEKASEYSRRAGKIAQKAALFKDAIEYAKETIYCLERLPGNETTQKKIIDARTRLAGYYLSIDHYVDAKEAVETIVNLSLELNYEKRLPIIYIVLGSYSLWVEENFLEALQNLKEALEISEKMNDSTSKWFARFFLGITLSLNCEFEKGLGYFRKSLDLGTESNNPIMITFAKSSMSTFNYIYHGKANLAYQMSRESLSTAQESGDVYLMGMAYSSCGIACFCKGLFKEAENMLLQALSFCEKITLLGWGTWGTGFLGHSYAEMGEYKTAIDTYHKGISELEQANLFPFWINVWKLSIIRLKVLDDDLDINQYEVFEYFRNIDVMAVKGWAARYVAEILLRIDKQNISKAEEWVIKALKTDKNNGTMWSLAGDYAFYAKLLVQKGEPIQAKKKLDEAIKIYKACGADGWVEKYEKELAAL